MQFSRKRALSPADKAEHALTVNYYQRHCGPVLPEIEERAKAYARESGEDKCPFLDRVNLHKICNQTWRRSVEMCRVYRRDAELFNGTGAAGLLQERKTSDQHKLQTLRRTMRGIVEDVLWEGGLLTTDEIYRGVKAKHAQLGQLLPPRWQEEVKRILEAHCISHEGNSWFLENIEQLIRQIQILEAHPHFA